ncbi:MAG: hypothetical protein ACR2IK_14930 [Chloroflexota bacterium]
MATDVVSDAAMSGTHGLCARLPSTDAWANSHNVDLVPTPTSASHLNRLERKCGRPEALPADVRKFDPALGCGFLTFALLIANLGTPQP